jgi:asparagine synthase (glutamine-hydrolysing)
MRRDDRASLMCGLTFIHQGGALNGELERRTGSALTRMRHRGPDGHGVISGPGWAIGHRRLSIIDVAGSPQPMRDPRQRYFLAYNGEVYNYRDLRRRLSNDWDFLTDGDTEVVLAGLICHGPTFLDRMEGMWAIVLWDSSVNRLTLIRDRMGKKPLYYQVSADGMACASELPALRNLVGAPWHEDEDSTADYLRYGYCLPGYTAYREVREVLPGHVMQWDADEGRVDQSAYWRLTPGRFSGTRQEAGEQLSAALSSAVRRRLVADVEVGAFLSGGVDSSLICALVRKTIGQPLKTFTIGFPEIAFDERRYARIAADALGTEHYEQVLKGWDEAELERLLLDHVGQPFADASLLPTSLVSQVAASKVKVALSGDGGDELFSGYERYRARTILRWYTRLPRGLRYLAERAVRTLPEPTAHHSRSLVKKAHLFVDIVGRLKAETPYFAPLLLDPDLLDRLAPELKGRGHAAPGIPEQTAPDDIARMMLADALIYLPQDILVKVDRASMAHSLEARAPFLDREVVELAFTLPTDWHRGSGGGKRMLRKTFAKSLPEALWNRRKQGFGVPIHSWFRGALGERFVELAQSPAHSLTRGVLHQLLADHRAGGRDHGYRLWLLYSYLLWKRSTA